MALTRITKGVIKPNENYDTHNINSTGIVTAIGLDVNGNGDISGNLSVGGVLTYEDVTSIDSVGLITARDGVFIPDDKKLSIGNAAGDTGDLQLFHTNNNSYIRDFGVGSLLIQGSGIYIQNNNGSTNIASFLENTGVSIPLDLDVDGHTNLDNVNVAGVTTISHAGSTSALIIDKGNASSDAIEINTTATSNACRIKFNESGSNKAQIAYSHDNDRLELVTQSGNEIAFYSGGNLTTRINTDGHLYPNTDSTYDLGLNGTRWRNLYADTLYGDIATIQDLDVDGHTNLDNVSIAGVTTFTSNSQYPLVIDGDHNGKVVLKGSNEPYIRFREGDTDKAYIQWHSDGKLILANQETNERLDIGSGSNGLQFLVDGVGRTVWHSGNDGAGSGLDADTLDNLGSGQFLRSDATDTATGDVTFTSNIFEVSGHWFNRYYDAANRQNYIHLYPHSGSNQSRGTSASTTDIRAWTGSTFKVLQIKGDSNDITWGGSKLWTAANDGAGSGLNADTLDGVQGSSFLRSDAADTCSGQITFTNQIISKADGNKSTQGGASLVLTHNTTPNLRMNFFIHDDFPTGKGTGYLQVTESGVSNDRHLNLQGYGGNIMIGNANATPTEMLDVNGNVKASHINLANSIFHTGDTSTKIQFGTGTIDLDSSNIKLGTGTRTLYYQRNLAAAINSTTEIVRFTRSNGGHSMRVSIVCSSSGFSVSKVYEITSSYNQTSSEWRVVRPISSTGSYDGNFELLYYTSNTVTELKLRKTRFANYPGNFDIAINYTGSLSFPTTITGKSATGTDTNSYLDLEEGFGLFDTGNGKTALTKPYHHPSFYAQHANNGLVTLTSGNVINYWNDGSTNKGFDRGGHFDNSTGIFTAPISGTYLFTATLLLFTDGSAGDIHIFWQRDNSNGGRLHYWGNTRIDHNSAAGYGGHYVAQGDSTTTYMNKGAQIWIGESHSGTLKLHTSDQNWGHFSGTLLG